MNEYLKRYIELKKQFQETEGNSNSVRALYDFKEKLEQNEDKQAKEVLVDVYDLLDFKKDAYELLCQIGDRSDKKALKRLGTLKDYAENLGNHYALPKPKTPEEKQREKERRVQLGLPAFRYHPDPLDTGAFKQSEEGVVCYCCGKTTHIFYTSPFFSVEEIAYLCPVCIASGEAARKYGGSFQDDYSVDDGVDESGRNWMSSSTAPPATPAGSRNTGAPTAASYCAFLGYVGARELRALGVLEEVLNDPMWDDEQKKMIQESVNGGHLQCYLFQCLHCGRHLVWMDFD
ncbi:CbrC family protein [Anaeromassilibacillus sp. SJQ-1]|uniref:CbrC family protein n=1 Tax=Anaeromassilibacillus sp. SJQ-1 TaxID=3375419 RepID=UPI003C7E5638